MHWYLTLSNTVSIYKHQQSYYLPTFDATVDQRSLPLGYAWQDEVPDPQKVCDLQACQHQGPDNTASTILTCGHSFHIRCIPPTHTCPICLPKLLAKLETLSKTFNEGLMKGPVDDPADDHDENNDDNDDDDNDDMITNSERSGSYYSSPEFRETLTQRFLERISEQ
ncbi:hypothetical protein QZH41_016778 [Actinostola sp. cb2023]|nr:hypothetical protein QZH41_016778 [Actinostola sp. cb2023]